MPVAGPDERVVVVPAGFAPGRFEVALHAAKTTTHTTRDEHRFTATASHALDVETVTGGRSLAQVPPRSVGSGRKTMLRPSDRERGRAETVVHRGRCGARADVRSRAARSIERDRRTEHAREGFAASERLIETVGAHDDVGMSD